MAEFIITLAERPNYAAAIESANRDTKYFQYQLLGLGMDVKSQWLINVRSKFCGSAVLRMAELAAELPNSGIITAVRLFA